MYKYGAIRNQRYGTKKRRPFRTGLSYAPVDEDDDTPDVAGSSDDKTSYTTAIATGKAYIAANS